MYITPPQLYMGEYDSPHSYHQSNWSSDDDQEARQEALARIDPDGRVVDSTRSQDGWTNKVHIMDRNGQYRTVFMDQNRHIVQAANGYC